MTLNDIKQDAKTLGFNGNTSHINIMCYKVFARPDKVYEILEQYGIGADSVLREKIFSYIADKFYNGDYDRVYNEWLGV